MLNCIVVLSVFASQNSIYSVQIHMHTLSTQSKRTTLGTIYLLGVNKVVVNV